MPKYVYLSVIMIVCGILGGITAHIADREKFWSKKLAGKISYGIIAAFLVPLFLNTISSNLVDDIGKNIQNIFIFIGFCLIASLSSKLFIAKLTDKTFDKEKAEQIDAVLETLALKNSEVPDKLNDDLSKVNTLKKTAFYHEPKQADKSNIENKILFELGRSEKAFLYPVTLSQNTGISIDSIRNVLKIMGDEKIITYVNIGNDACYGINAAGMERYKNLINSIEWQIEKIGEPILINNSKTKYKVKVKSEEYKHELEVYTAIGNIELKEGDKIKAGTLDGNIVDINKIIKL